ncbi:MAG TPA: sugar ABC transporter substrate-binding protein, partial [Aestuariivirga sp.]|nr:sugar ABC transporter substrate-binding protein [Aestuariivirga sp.]
PEASFLLLAFLTTSSIMAMNEANANGVAPGYRSVLTNENLQKVSQPAKIWSEELDYAWCSPRLPSAFEMEQEIGFLINDAIVGKTKPKEALDAAAAKVKSIMTKSGFYAGKDPVSYASMAPGLNLGAGKKAPI